MLITRELLDELTARAKASDRLRMHFDLRDSAEDGSMRMLNAIEPGTEIPVHRHRETSEDVIVLRGEVMEVLFDDSGAEIERYHLVAGTDCVACHVPLGVYHTCRSLVSGSVIFEFKNGGYDPLTTEDLLPQK